VNGPALGLLVLQVLAILGVTSACGWVARRIGQPKVIGEIAGGLLMGPLVLGYFFPAASAFLFAPAKLYALDTLSSIGLVLFLFLMGAELDLEAVRQNRGASLRITAGSVGLPFILGAALAPWLLVRFGTAGVSRLGFGLFIAISMSITAMPVLARILQDRRDAGRPIDGAVASLAMVCAAANDLLGWALLALTLSLLHGWDAVPAAALRLGLLAIYVVVMVFLVRPALQRAARGREPAVWMWLPGLMLLAFLSARVTETLGIHAFFGAFLAGICAPRLHILQERLQRVLRPVIWFTLPLFFAMTGLRMRREAFSLDGLGWLGVILLLAVVSKVGGSLLGARAGGMAWKEAAQIGILLNTRGLVELIVLNIGDKEGLLGPLLFTLFVLMAVLTTVMTAPLFELSQRFQRRS
jgi:Kef-type K+ transport system membrane component KefB